MRKRPVGAFGFTFFQRIFGLVSVSLILAALLTSLLYVRISRMVFSAIRSREMAPQVVALGELMAPLVSGEGNQDQFRVVLETARRVTRGGLVLIGARGEAVVSDGIPEEWTKALENQSEALYRAEAGQTLSITLTSGGIRGEALAVGGPVLQNGRVIGALFLLRPMTEVDVGAQSLDSAMLLALLSVLGIMTLPVYGATRHIISPLRNMRDVANAMAGGNYLVRANDVQRGEMGQLAQSLNDLARRLSRTVTDLTVERNRLRMILGGLDEGIVAVNTLGAVTQHNPAVLSLFGHDAKGEYVDPRLAIVPHKSVWVDFETVLGTRKPIARQIVVGERILQVTISPLEDDGGNLVGALAMFRDETERERLEQTRRDYVANVSHEMRTPLTAIRGLVEPLRDGMVREEEDRQRYYAILLRESMRLSRLVDDLMELSRLQSGQLSLKKRLVNLGEILSDIDEKWQVTARDAGIGFDMEVSPGDCPAVYGNPDRIEEVLVILLDNAVKYTQEGGSIALFADWDEEKVRLYVRDNGIGIAKADQAQVFDRFYKVDRAHSGMGSGLGLSIAREMLEAMGEEIGLESAPGQGSVFWFTVSRHPHPRRDS